ncbi:hypothetical protein EV127DRAFT_441068 [Xylaria flabelliformis]|nr:hypothetical protein EV127DRAFT_441068 [Xylaria flabelliformis]
MAKQEDVHEELSLRVLQDSPANSQRSQSATHFELNDLIGTVLGRGFEIGKRLCDDNNNHFIAFAVRQHDAKIGAAEDGTNGLVARIYDMNNLTPNHKRYKIRSINRSASRTVFKTTWSSCQIIIMKTGPLDDIQTSTKTENTRFDINSSKQETNHKRNRLSLCTSEVRVASGRDDQQVVSTPLSINSNITSLEQKQKPISKQKMKTVYQRESSRLRQRDRRAAKRCQQRSTSSQIRLNLQPQSLSESLSLKDNVHGLDDDTFTMLVMLHFAFNPRPELRMGLPDKTRTQIEGFLAARTKKVALSNDDEKLDFVQMKESELVSLRRLTNKLHGLTQQCHNELHGLLGEQISTRRRSTEWNRLQENFIEPRKQWYRVLLSASKELPKLATESEKLIDLLKNELKEASELKEKRRILNRKKWIHCLVPGSETHYQLLRALEYTSV